MNVTIIIPTKNRTKFIKRQLQYYDRSKFTGFLFFGDASDDDVYEENVKLIDQFSNTLKIKHFHDKEKSSEQVTSDLVKLVTTKYMTLLPDDDLIITPAIEECIEYLDKNNDYSAAHGKAYEMTINYGKADAFGRLTGMTPYRMISTDENSAIDRIKTYFNYVTNINMAIIRTEIAVDAYRACNGLDYYFSSLLFGELTHGSFVLTKGKIKELNCTYLVRQVHNSQYFDTMNLVDWFSKPNWCESYSILKSVIFSNILDKGSDTYYADKKEMEQMLSLYMKNLFNASGKANFLHKMKKNTIFNKVFRLYRHFKLHSQGKVKMNNIRNIDDYVYVIQHS
jgi:glycosyltransferase domain-containing protein